MKAKLKTNKAISKRFKLTATGKVKFKQAGLRHNLGKKGRKKKRNLRAGAYVFPGNSDQVMRGLPYGSLL